MEFPINLVLQLKTEQEYDLVQRALDPDSHITADDISTFDKLREQIEYRRLDSAKEARIRVGASEIAQGTIEEMSGRFRAECGMHSNSNIILEEWVNGNWKQKQVRKLQKI